MTNKELKKIQDTTENIVYSQEENCKLKRKLTSRVEELTSQQCLTSNILIEMALADSREDLTQRLDYQRNLTRSQLYNN